MSKTDLLLRPIGSAGIFSAACCSSQPSEVWVTSHMPPTTTTTPRPSSEESIKTIQSVEISQTSLPKTSHIYISMTLEGHCPLKRHAWLYVLIMMALQLPQLQLNQLSPILIFSISTELQYLPAQDPFQLQQVMQSAMIPIHYQVEYASQVLNSSPPFSILLNSRLPSAKARSPTSSKTS